MAAQGLFTPLTLKRGPALKNRILLAPLTNWQCHEDGTVSEHEVQWLTRCAAGGFSMVMTCAANVKSCGKAFPGQMGIYDDKHLPGLRRVAEAVKSHGVLSSVQLHHWGLRVDPQLAGGGAPVGPSDIQEMGVRGLSLAEVEALVDDFVAAAQRAERAGFDGVEVHAAFGWILMQFITPLFNRRTDKYGGSLENRSRLLFDVIHGIRAACRPNFQIGLRISMERYGMSLMDAQEIAARAMREEDIDYLDLALWDYTKLSQEEPFLGRTLLSVFTELPRSAVRLGASGKIMSVQQRLDALEAGCDFVMLGKAAIIDTRFPHKAENNLQYSAPSLPVSKEYLKEQGLSDTFIAYLRTWENFVTSSWIQIKKL
ncbi:hypothetical protein SLS64_011293 [Diaporthe eres]|uniref:NADH:flavin oxidoreductase/NADH oxidase N-terminal domain-containing protein n=1 Tax=Diaporthe eres TaxID=83184 RepID=A0ABR1P9H5_DIAER